MLKTYIGPFEIELVIHGESFGILKNGDSVAVPNELAATVGWDDEIWKDGTPAKKESK